jgi:hypothetical protein
MWLLHVGSGAGVALDGQKDELSGIRANRPCGSPGYVRKGWPRAVNQRALQGRILLLRLGTDEHRARGVQSALRAGDQNTGSTKPQRALGSGEVMMIAGAAGSGSGLRLIRSEVLSLRRVPLEFDSD